MKRFMYPVAALAAPLLMGADKKGPPLDANPPAKTETATFALG